MSTTAVPLRPIAKGSLTRLWIGVAAVALAAGGLAWAGQQGVESSPAAFLTQNSHADGVVTTESGLQYKVLSEGTGASPTTADVALVGYKGTLLDGTVFDENPQAPMPIDGVVPGFSEGLQKMKKGGKYRLWIPPQLGYGDQAAGPIPAGSVLVFDVTLHDFKSKAELMQIQQQMQQQQGGMPQGAIPHPGN
ncbi:MULTISPECIES: FKBP-type peptidyl-prolyl cis-trans isomerase [Sphingobium]|jgi:FKBP-type peptidyl-prolyl cis-trans isomerase FkpA|uniref:FKBP-type peptidyl-prolyl cis-trans isomerase n=1 Tax=Sphingobium TaxID=165695 RepID=UPI000E73ED53|nr:MULTISPECIES: FKBP-type peptidyl-prolyl cis-trans isomerase [Sphingobium]KAA9015634.1 FKBP-type peptidyl-prolyl cis-trans isomerase [Sphingobium limneticum]MBU0932038.1 FKBP-type peptidyl-prolyl cis-trans isomerase [Alphaproteobacteria bacterium]